MARVIWSPEASRRLIEIDAYVRLAAPESANLVVDRIVEAAERLASFPWMGRRLPDAGTVGAREFIVDSYRVVYRTDGEMVEIATVLHNAMDIPTRLRELFGEA